MSKWLKNKSPKVKVVADAALTALSSRAAELTHIQSASSTSMLDTNVSLEFQSYLRWVMIYWACVLLGVFFFYRSCTVKEQVHCGHKLDWYHLPGREREEAGGALLPWSDWSQHHQVETESEEEEVVWVYVRRSWNLEILEVCAFEDKSRPWSFKK